MNKNDSSSKYQGQFDEHKLQEKNDGRNKQISKKFGRKLDKCWFICSSVTHFWPRHSEFGNGICIASEHLHWMSFHVYSIVLPQILISIFS